MTSITSLPVELLVYVAQDLEHVSNVSALSRSCRRMYDATISVLYRRVKNDPKVMHWAVTHGHVRTVKYLLAAGADPNVAWVQEYDGRRLSSQLINVRCFPQLTRMIKTMGKNAITASEGGSKLAFGSDTIEMDSGDSAYDDYLYDEYTESEFDSDEDDEDTSDTEYESDSGTDIGDGDGEGEGDDSENDDNVAGGLTFPGPYYWTPLHVAASHGYDELIEVLLNYGANIHALSRGLCTCSYPTPHQKFVKKPVYPLWMPLHTAICYGHDSTARLLLARGAATFISTRGDGANVGRVTALHSACYSGMTSLSRFLIDQGYQTDVESKDHLDMTPMSYAYFSGNWECINLLVERGATLDTKIGLFTLFKHACFYSRFCEALRFVELGADMDINFNEGIMSPLHCCCMQPYLVSRGRVRLPKRVFGQYFRRDVMVETLLEAGARIGTRNDKLETPLIQAAGYHFASTVEFLLASGANPAEHDSLDRSALISACAAGINSPKGELLRIVKALLSRLPHFDDCAVALQSICATSNRLEDKREVARLLFEHGGSTSLERMAGQHMLSCAIAHGNYEIADLLFENGLRQPNANEIYKIIDATIKKDNSSGLRYIITKSPDAADTMKGGDVLYKALLSRGGKCARFLIKAGVPATYRGEDGTTCLIRATAFTRTKLARMLLERGADPNELSDRHHSPLSFPIIRGNASMVSLLLDHGAKSK